MDGRFDGFDGPGVYVFDRFRLDPVSRTVTRDGQALHLQSRLFDTLLHLVANADALVDRAELRQAVWPGRVVEDGNIDRAISSLRTALTAHGAPRSLIVTITGRGYKLGASVVVERLMAPVEEPTVGNIESQTLRAPTSPNRYLASPRLRLGLLATAMVFSIAAISWFVYPKGTGTLRLLAEPPPHSVAVLPFKNLNSDPRQETFSDGISEEIINALGRVQGLHVAAGLSSFQFKGTQTGVRDIAGQLHVGTLLEGAVERSGGHILVTVQLIDAATGYQLWARRFDRQQTDLMSVEGEIAETVAGSLKVALTGETNLMAGGTADPAAFDFYLVGMSILAKTDDDANQEAARAFSSAIAHDGRYALAFARRAQILAYQSATAAAPDLVGRRKTMAMAMADAEKSVFLAPNLGAAHAALALVLRFSLSDFSRAQVEYTSAVNLSPGDAPIVMNYAFFELEVGHTDAAIEAAQHAAALDPLTPMTYKMLSEVYAEAGRFDDALSALRHAQDLRPDAQGDDHIYRGIIETLQGDAAGAIRTCAGALDYHDLSCLAWAYQKLGRQAEADSALAKLHSLAGDDAAYLYARIAAQWNRPDESLRWLQKAFELQDAGLLAIRVDPFLKSIRLTDQYRQIESRMRFPL